MKSRLALVVAAGLLAAPSALAASQLNRAQAITIVQNLLKKRAAACDIDAVYSIRATAPALDRFRVTASIRQGGFKATTIFWVAGNGKITAGGPLEADIVAGSC